MTRSTVLAAFLFLILIPGALAQEATSAQIPGLASWKSALIAGDLASLDQLYSPRAIYVGDDKQPKDISEETQFWQDFLAKHPQSVDVVVRSTKEQQGLQMASLTVSFKTDTPQGRRTRYVLVQQAWKQMPEGWFIVAARHSDIIKMPQPASLNPNLYPKNVDAHEEIKEAVANAAREHKRVILVFGANWCYDCHVLDFALHHSDAAPVAEKNFVVVHVDIGDDGKLNADVVKEYKVPLDKGVPALAVLDSTGKLLYSQQNGEFEAARSMDPDDLIAFLNKWKP